MPARRLTRSRGDGNTSPLPLSVPTADVSRAASDYVVVDGSAKAVACRKSRGNGERGDRCHGECDTADGNAPDGLQEVEAIIGGFLERSQ